MKSDSYEHGAMTMGVARVAKTGANKTLRSQFTGERKR
jgi:hypothetical protein